MEAEKLNPSGSYIHDFELFTKEKNFWQTSLLKQVEDLNIEQVLFLPAPGRHCIWEIVRHISYWKFWALKYVNENVSLDAKADNWKSLPEEQTQKSWEADLEYLKSLNEQCLKTAKELGNTIFESAEEPVVFFRQVIYHDCYHNGQIGLLRALQGIKPVS